MLDRGLSYKEKYGGERGWRLLLRFDENRKGEVLEWREDVGNIFSLISAQCKDDRWKEIELIRRHADSPGKQGLALLRSDQKQPLALHSGEDQASGFTLHQVERSLTTQHHNEPSKTAFTFYGKKKKKRPSNLAQHPWVQERYKNKPERLQEVMPSLQDDDELASLSVEG